MIEKKKKKRKRQKTVNDGFIEDDNFTGEELDEYTEASPIVKPIRKEKTIGAFPRSNVILTPLAVSNKVGKKVDDILVEQLGIGLRPMPTKAICQAFNELRQDIVIMLDLQKHLAEKEYQVQMFKDQKQILFKGKKGKAKIEKKDN